MLTKIKSAVEWLKNIRVQVTVAVLTVEKEFGGLSGLEKRAKAVAMLDALIKLPWWLDNLLNVDGMLLGYMVDKVCDALNILTDGNFADVEIDPEKLAVVAEAPINSIMAASASVSGRGSKQLTVDERLAELYKQYGIEAEVIEEERAELPDEPEAVTISTPGVAAVPKTSADEKWDKCIKIVGAAEGGANFDVIDGKAVIKAKSANDKGGLTNYGITQTTLASAYAKGVVGHCDIIKLTKAEAETIYRSMYCDLYGWLELPYEACLCLLDATINHGLGGTAIIAQRACNAMMWIPELVVDGKWGPKTKEAVWSIAPGNTLGFAYMFLYWRKDYFDRIIAKNSSQEVFRNGWYNRLRMLAKECGVESPV